MSIVTILVLILMFVAPTISVMALMLQSADKSPTSRQHSRVTNSVMLLFSIGIHLLGARGLMGNYLNLSGSGLLITIMITTVVTLLLGWGLGLLVQDLRQTNT
ncbi:hypothetical protein [Candidatus Leptofilum sp.]|uniref:hypothetical protein n=1 Tax=Candidatus Leptofilum sp. TaxID=3241576 RepID=UPI003B5B301B